MARDQWRGSPRRTEAAKALYHAACCVASNGLVALAHRAVDLFGAAGVGRAEALAALSPLITGTALNLAAAEEPADVLTGPIARGDLRVIDAHRRAIAAAQLVDAGAAYDALCLEITRTARLQAGRRG